MVLLKVEGKLPNNVHGFLVLLGIHKTLTSNKLSSSPKPHYTREACN